MFCSKCGNKLEDDWKACPICGESCSQTEKKTIYVEKERIRFSHQWLIPKLILIGAFLIHTAGQLIDDGIGCLLLNGTWGSLIVWDLIFSFFEAWFHRNVINYAGNEYIVTFGIPNELFAKAETIMNKVNSSVLTVLCVLYFILIVKNIFSIGIFSLDTWLAPAITLRNLIMLYIAAQVLGLITKVYRPVTKDDFDTETPLDDLFEEKKENK